MKRLGLYLSICLVLVTACGQATPTLPPTQPPTQTAIPSPTPEPGPTVAPTAVPGVLYVDPAQDLGPISPYIFGANHGIGASISLEMLPTALDSGITALRWPGGAWGDDYDMKGFQVDQFLAFCDQMGALPTISVRLDGGTPEAAAELVRYANIQKKYGLVYWSIGNEPTLYEADLGETYDTVRFNKEWRDIAEAMKAVDPSIKLMGPELHQWGTNLQTTLKDSSGRDWMTEFLKANGDLVDVVTVHRYPLGNTESIDELRQNTPEWTGLVVYLRSLIAEITGRDLPIAFTEVNSTPRSLMGGDATPDSFYNAIWYADVLGRLVQQRVFMVNYWILGKNSGLGLFYNSEVRPTFYVFKMYQQFGSQLVFASSGIEDVTVYAAKRPDGTLTILVINLSDVEQQTPLQINGLASGKAEVWLFDAAHQAENLGQQDLPADGTLALPPQSITLLAIGSSQ
ncbi:MAG: hypothetical protein EHM70_00830 [Chloroflexota bacterium]|nr:MAG: hypothetical protein EHM70_00830 [Chloroflexota bacterium]